MIKSTANMTYSRAFMDALLKTFTTIPTAKLINAPTIRLCSGTMPAITPDTTLASLVALETNYSGYAAAVVTLTDPVRLSVNAEGAIATATFEATTASPFVPATISGYFLTDGAVLVGAEAFPVNSQAPIAFVGDFLTLTVVLPGQCYQAPQ